MEIRSFKPLYTPNAPAVGIAGATTPGTLSPTTNVTTVTATAVASAVLPGTMQNDQVQLYITNQTVSWVYVNVGVFGSVTAATAASLPIAPNSSKTITVDREVTGASVFLPTGGTVGTVGFTRGVGL